MRFSLRTPALIMFILAQRQPSLTSGPPSTLQDVAHIWELGGGSHVSDLVRVPITPDRFHDALYVIVVDLSRPSSVIPHLLQWTDQIKVFVALVRC